MLPADPVALATDVNFPVVLRGYDRWYGPLRRAETR
jgi:hypothetical protein